MLHWYFTCLWYGESYYPIEDKFVIIKITKINNTKHKLVYNVTEYGKK
jgi:hypothetical protein